MAEVSDQSKDVTGNLSSVDKTKETKTAKKQRKGIFSRMWNGLFGSRKDDFEKRLQNISKEEATVMARMKRRTQSWRRMARNLIVFSVLLEAVAVAYAIMMTRTMELEWKTRAVRVLPMFLLPGLTAVIYTTLGSFSRMCEQKDKKTLERLREERQTKIDELKERTNYYITQQLIQRYDSDPAAKAAAASVLASKLGAESGFKVFLGDDSKVDPASGKSRDVELAQSKGLRNRHNRSNSTGTLALNQSAEEVPDNVGPTGSEPATHNHVVVDNHPNSTVQDGGWVARIAALLVGEDPTQSYALICGNCHMHNGLARKEDFAYITYYCPHCHALNKSKQLQESGASVTNSSNASIPDTPNSGEVTIAPTTSNLINKNLSAVVETLAGEIDEKVAEEPNSS